MMLSCRVLWASIGRRDSAHQRAVETQRAFRAAELREDERGLGGTTPLSGRGHAKVEKGFCVSPLNSVSNNIVLRLTRRRLTLLTAGLHLTDPIDYCIRPLLAASCPRQSESTTAHPGNAKLD